MQSYGQSELATGTSPTLTLHDGLGQTLFFSDRPERIVGTVPTPQFLGTLGFDADNPPNAALVGEKDNGDQDLLVVELLNPAYDQSTHTATYSINVLADDERVDMQFTTQTGTVPPPTSYIGAHLFIDDCPDASVWCQSSRGNLVGTLPGQRGMCWNWSAFSCDPCAARSESRECNATYPTCNGRCSATRLLV